MHTGVDAEGRPFIPENTARKGDYVDLLALIDVLAVPNVCGADVMMTSNFELKPLKLTVFEATDADWAEVIEPPRRKNQRSPADFKVKAIKADRELRPDSSYRPEFTNVPLQISELKVEADVDRETPPVGPAEIGTRGNRAEWNLSCDPSIEPSSSVHCGQQIGARDQCPHPTSRPALT